MRLIVMLVLISCKAKNNLVNQNHQSLEDLHLIDCIKFEKLNKNIKLLLDNGANPNAKDLNGITALKWAVIIDKVEIVNLFLAEGADVNYKDEKGETALHKAISLDKKEIAEALLKNGANPNETYKDGEAFLIHAIKNKKLDIFRLLLKNKANPNVKSKDNILAIALAISYKELDYFNLLVEYKANVNVKDTNGSSILELLIEKQKYDIILKLLDTDIHFNTKNLFNILNSIIELKDAKKIDQCIKISNIFSNELLKSNRLKIDNTFTRVIDSLKLLKYERLNETLKNISNCLDESNSIFKAIDENNGERIIHLLKKHKNVEQLSIEGYTPLIHATKKSKINIVKLLLREGADINGKDLYKNTPLRIARHFEIPELVKLFLEDGAIE